MTGRNRPLTDEDYVALSNFRYAIRRFQAFSEECASGIGLTPRQHQALLAIRAVDPAKATVGYVAERLILKPHSATGLIDRLEGLGLVRRQTAENDRRRALLRLTERAYTILDELSGVHRDEIKRLKPLLATIFEQLEA